MKDFGSRRFNGLRNGGFMLVDCLVYITLVTVVLGIGGIAFYRCWDSNKALRRDADDIVRALNAGELWRADIRSATGPIRSVQQADMEKLQIPNSGGEVDYVLHQNELRRQTSIGQNSLLLSGVIHSQMAPDPRKHVSAWRWDLELSRTRRATVLKPLFTFEAVPAQLADSSK